jgi:hypothetical protein
LLAAVEAEEAVKSLTPQGLKEYRGAESRARGEYRRAITDIGDDIIAQERASAQSFLSSQTLGALESGEDQVTSRVMRGVLRNEDLDASQVNAVARQTGNAEVAASLTPDGIPADQTDILNPTATAAKNRQQQAQSFLGQKRQELSGQFSPTRVERILSQNPEIIEAAELYATTGDPNVLSRFSSEPSSPVTVKPASTNGN